MWSDTALAFWEPVVTWKKTKKTNSTVLHLVSRAKEQHLPLKKSFYNQISGMRLIFWGYRESYSLIVLPKMDGCSCLEISNKAEHWWALGSVKAVQVFCWDRAEFLKI